MVPSHQRLQAVDGAVQRLHQGLVVHRDRAVGQGAAQRQLGDGAHAGGLPHVRRAGRQLLSTIVIATLKLFDIIAATTGGNYNTSVLSFEMYNQTFVIRNAGRGAALAIILFLAVTPILIYNIRVLRRERTIR